jgi:hypothetical protein
VALECLPAVPAEAGYLGEFTLLAPSTTLVPDAFRCVDVNPERHERILTQLQRLRGRVYLHDGAIEPSQLSSDGRHRAEIDDHSWHVVSLLPDGRVTGCARYRVHRESVRFEDLGVWASPLAHHADWQPVLREAVESEIALARRRNLAYAEVGGWAVAEDLRFTPQAVDIALSTYALAQKLGGCVGITTATVRNASSRILRKIGGRPLEVAACPLPSYYDPQYRCDMELLRFESNAPNPRYQTRMARVANRLQDLTVVCAKGPHAERSLARRFTNVRPPAPKVSPWPQ